MFEVYLLVQNHCGGGGGWGGGGGGDKHTQHNLLSFHLALVNMTLWCTVLRSQVTSTAQHIVEQQLTKKRKMWMMNTARHQYKHTSDAHV